MVKFSEASIILRKNLFPIFICPPAYENFVTLFSRNSESIDYRLFSTSHIVKVKEMVNLILY